MAEWRFSVGSPSASASRVPRADRMTGVGGAPTLRADISIIEQVYRGETSFVVKDLAAQKYFRFGAVEVRVLRAFDGTRTSAEIAAALAEEGLRISAQAVESFARTMGEA